MPQMKTNPMRWIPLFLVLALALSTGSAHAMKWGRGIKGSGDLETRTIEADRFDSIELRGAFDVQVRVGRDQSVQVTIDDNLWTNLVAEVHGGTLELGWDENCRPDRDCRVEITVPKLSSFELMGAGDVEIEGLKGDSFEFDLRGAGDVQLQGEVDKLEIRLAGAGDVDAHELKADHVEAQVSGAGNASVYAKKSIRGRVSGVGNLEYYGDPEERDTHVSGVGHIRRK